MKSILCFLLLCLLSLCAEALSSSASLDIKVVIPSIVRVKVLTQPQNIVITAQDIKSGYTDAESVVSLYSNSREEFSVFVQYDKRVFQRVEIDIDGQHHVLLSDMAFRVSSSTLQEKKMAVKYRFFFRPNQKAGGAIWPIILSFSLAAV